MPRAPALPVPTPQVRVRRDRAGPIVLASPVIAGPARSVRCPVMDRQLAHRATPPHPDRLPPASFVQLHPPRRRRRERSLRRAPLRNTPARPIPLARESIRRLARMRRAGSRRRHRRARQRAAHRPRPDRRAVSLPVTAPTQPARRHADPLPRCATDRALTRRQLARRRPRARRDLPARRLSLPLPPDRQRRARAIRLTPLARRRPAPA